MVKTRKNTSRKTNKVSAVPNTNRCYEQFCKKEFTRRQKKEIAKSMLILRQLTRRTKTKLPFKLPTKVTKKDLEICRKGYCNPGCSNTMFQSGKMFPTALKKETLKGKHSKIVLDLLTEMRKRIFNGKTSVLKDDFYEKLSPEEVALAKRKGAISGCTVRMI